MQIFDRNEISATPSQSDNCYDGPCDCSTTCGIRLEYGTTSVGTDFGNSYVDSDYYSPEESLLIVYSQYWTVKQMTIDATSCSETEFNLAFLPTIMTYSFTSGRYGYALDVAHESITSALKLTATCTQSSSEPPPASTKTIVAPVPSTTLTPKQNSVVSTRIIISSQTVVQVPHDYPTTLKLTTSTTSAATTKVSSTSAFSTSSSSTSDSSTSSPPIAASSPIPHSAPSPSNSTGVRVGISVAFSLLGLLIAANAFLMIRRYRRRRRTKLETSASGTDSTASERPHVDHELHNQDRPPEMGGVAMYEMAYGALHELEPGHTAQ